NPDDVFARFRDHTAARLDLLPLYRQRLETPPLGLDHPAWVDDDDLDLDYHIHRAALPKPGTMKQLRALVAQLHTIPLDRTRPLWQYYLIQGLEDGGFAVYFKFHHCDMDGVALMATLDATYDSSPDSAARPSVAQGDAVSRAATGFPRADRHGRRRFPGSGISRGEIAAGPGEDAGESVSESWQGRPIFARLCLEDAADALQRGGLEPPQLRHGVAFAARREGAGEGEQCNDQRRGPGSLRRRLASLSDGAPVVARCAADSRRAGLPARARRHPDEQ